MFFYILLFLLASVLMLSGKIRLQLHINGIDCIIEGDIMLFGLPIFKRALYFSFTNHKIRLYVLRKRIRKKEGKKDRHSRFKLKDVLTGIVLKKMVLSIKIGLGRADKTALTSGALYSVLSFIAAKTGNNSQVNITPEFNKNTFSLEGECIIKVKLIHIIHKLLFK